MIAPRRAVAALGTVALVAAVGLGSLPVTIHPSAVLPNVLRAALPSAFQKAELSCGSVARPHRPELGGGVLQSLAATLRVECTKAVRDRMWSTFWVALGGVTMMVISGVGFSGMARRRRRQPGGPTTLPPPTAGTIARMGIGAVLLLTSLTSMNACSESQRTAAAFCSTMKSEQSRILAQFNSSKDAAAGQNDAFANALMGVGATVQALGELRTYFHKLSAVAPKEIEEQTKLVADWYDDQVKSSKGAISNPLGTLASSALDGIMISGPMNTVNKFALQNCGQSV